MGRRRNLQVEENRYYNFIRSKIPKDVYGYIDPLVFLEKIKWMDEHLGVGVEDDSSILELDALEELLERTKLYKENRSFALLDKRQNELYSKSLKYLFEYRGLQDNERYRELFYSIKLEVKEYYEDENFQDSRKDNEKDEINRTVDESGESESSENVTREADLENNGRNTDEQSAGQNEEKAADDAESTISKINVAAEINTQLINKYNLEEERKENQKGEAGCERNLLENQNVAELIEEQVGSTRHFGLADEDKLIRFYKQAKIYGQGRIYERERSSRRRIEWLKQNYWSMLGELLLHQFKGKPVVCIRAKNRCTTENLTDGKRKIRSESAQKRLTEIVSIKEPKREDNAWLRIKAKIPDHIDDRNRKKGFVLWMIFVRDLSSSSVSDALKLMDVCNELIKRFQISKSDIWDIESVEELENYYSMLEADRRFRVINRKHFCRLQIILLY